MSVIKIHFGEKRFESDTRLWSLCGFETKTKSRNDRPITTDVSHVTCGSCNRCLTLKQVRNKLV